MLNHKQMLPDRIRSMRQMKDLLDAEDLILMEIVQMIDEMYARSSLLHEEVINEKWLEEKLKEKTGADTEVTAYAEQLLVAFLFDVSNLYDIDILEVRAFLNKWLPAHLMYRLTLLLSYAVKHQETFLMQKVIFTSGMPFWRCLVLNGAWRLDGSTLLDSVRAKAACSMAAGCQIGMQESFEVQATFRGLWYLDGTYLLDGSKKLAEIWEEEL